VPALGPVLSARQDTATPVPSQKPARTLAPTRTPRPTEPAVSTVEVATEPPVPTEPPAPTEPAATKGSGPAQATPTKALATQAPTPTRRPTADLPAAVARSMDEIQQQVIDLRGLQPSGNFYRDVLTPDQLRGNVLRDFNRDNTPEDIRNEVLELSTLGLLEAGSIWAPSTPICSANRLQDITITKRRKCTWWASSSAAWND